MQPPAVLHVLSGPTAVGKTEWALRWAEQRAAEVVSCDSLLFYRGLDIGTAKPSPAERGRVRHHLIDICAVAQPMNVTYYVTLARRAVDEIRGRGRAVLVAGGSGFYLKAFFAAVADEVGIAPEMRARVAEMAADEAVAKLRELNPGGLEGLDTANPRRVVRALERCLTSGQTLRELKAAFSRQKSAFVDFEVKLTRLERDPEDLSQRIGARVDAMLRAGLVEEVRRLRGEGLEQNPSAARAIGYRETIAMLDGKLPEAELGAEIAKNTRALVKKQRTWFRTQLPEHRVLMAGEVRNEAELFG